MVKLWNPAAMSKFPYKFLLRPLLTSFLVLTSGCSTLPSLGPSSDAIFAAANFDKEGSAEATKFQLIDISQEMLPAAIDKRPAYFSERLTAQELLKTNHKAMQGDIISIRIWEAANDGLFANSGQRETNFDLAVSNAGSIDVPYAGSIPVIGKSVQQIRQVLLERFSGKAIDPEINVAIRETSSLGVSVLGAVAIPGRITIPPQGVKLLDLLALAGGVPHALWENSLTITRGDSSETLAIDRIFAQTVNNVVVLPGDTIQVDFAPRKFAVYGAIAKPGNIVIDNPEPRLSDLLAESGGLNDMQAEASSVFVFRPTDKASKALTIKATAYRLDFSRPDAFLLASQFEIASTDIVYVATADASKFRKFVRTLLLPFIGSTGSIQNLGT